MNELRLRSSLARLRARVTGFSLIELMITVAIVGILAGIALPSYFTAIKRSRIIEGTTALGDIRSQMEKYYMDNRTYVTGGGACGVTTYAPDPIAAFNGSSKNFNIVCPDPAGAPAAATTYSLAATGIGPMTGFEFTVDNQNTKISKKLPAGWAYPAPNTCWATRPDGSCD